jgi:hypothetical protein
MEINVRKLSTCRWERMPWFSLDVSGKVRKEPWRWVTCSWSKWQGRWWQWLRFCDQQNDLKWRRLVFWRVQNCIWSNRKRMSIVSCAFRLVWKCQANIIWNVYCSDTFWLQKFVCSPMVITLHYITLHYVPLHYTTLHYVTSHHITHQFLNKWQCACCDPSVVTVRSAVGVGQHWGTVIWFSDYDNKVWWFTPGEFIDPLNCKFCHGAISCLFGRQNCSGVSVLVMHWDQ